MPYRPKIKNSDGSLTDLPLEAETAVKLKTSRSIGLSGVTATAQSFNGTSAITIPVTAVPATLLTGTASTGTILLREIDGEFKTPAAENMVYQNFPAIVFGFPMMFLATYAPQNPVVCMIIFLVLFAALNVLLFRKSIFKRQKSKNPPSCDEAGE